MHLIVKANEGENLEATNCYFMFPEITEENRNSFHLHGDIGELPISSVLLLPKDVEQHNIALGDYELRKDVQAVRPKIVVETILEILLGIQRALDAYFFVVSFSTLSFFSLILYLSKQIEINRVRIMERMGASKKMIRWMFIAEVSIVLLFSFIGYIILFFKYFCDSRPCYKLIHIWRQICLYFQHYPLFLLLLWIRVLGKRRVQAFYNAGTNHILSRTLYR